ncbi:hypothetical protein IW261DRAFT_1440863 [Armillaria novae-zelandiae]|uniref:Uncharacterized protein n=1 Tax=Armillaria novae-zelandiae TaxID=153914 RepID=A0AA39PQJ3_9AGAR|nr:hypothetical protein IW261DRAFT_1440863 [Armillaria novae-zelandiae]
MDASSTSTSHVASNPKQSRGPSRRTPAASVLWAHLLRKDTLAAPPSLDVPLPPVAPIDRTGTSLRILLHDTQAHIERFSEHVEKLTKGADEAKQELGLTKTLFQREHEELTNEMYNLVNRCQTEIQKTTGRPAQAERMEEFCKGVQLRLDGLDKRIDAMQLLYLSSSQTLQNQSQALQAIQDQQGTILSALLPLLPLLQAIPLHIETARSSIKETIIQSRRSERTSGKIPDTRSSSPVGLDPCEQRSPLSGRKRRRVDENTSCISKDQKHQSLAGATRNSTHSSSLSKRKSTLLVPAQRQPSSALDSSSTVLSSLTGMGMRTPYLEPRTPRRPLAEIAQYNDQSALRPSLTKQVTSVDIRDRASSLRGRRPSVFPPTSRPSRLPHLPISAPTPVSKSSEPDTGMTTGAVHRASYLSGSLILPHAQPTGQSICHLPARVSPVTSIALSRRTTTSQQQGVRTTPHTNIFPAPPPTLRQRRSPFREGRRFIPLDDSDDSDVDAVTG